MADLEAHGVTTHLLDAPRDRDLGWVRRLRHLVEEGRFDVVHAHSPVPAASARVAMRSIPAARRPVFVYTEHNRWPSHSRATRAANAATFALNDATIAVSAEVRDSLAAPFRSDTSVIVHGIDLDAVRALRREREATRAELGVEPDEVLAVTVANFRAPKGYPDLLAAAHQVTQGPERVRFVIVGQGPLEEDLRRRHAGAGAGFGRGDPRLSPRRLAAHRGRRPVRVGLPPRRAARGRHGGHGRGCGRGGHRRGGAARGHRQRHLRPVGPGASPRPAGRGRPPAGRRPPAAPSAGVGRRAGRRGLLRLPIRTRGRGRLSPRPRSGRPAAHEPSAPRGRRSLDPRRRR